MNTGKILESQFLEILEITNLFKRIEHFKFNKFISIGVILSLQLK